VDVLGTPVAEATYRSGEYSSLEAIVREFLTQHRQPVERAGFGVAGPVLRDRAEITNLPWVIDGGSLAREFSLASVALVNDLAAIATAVPHLDAGDLVTLNTGEAEPGGAIGVIAPGTGLGEAYLTWNGTRYEAHGSEGGHADFAPTDADQIDLLRYLMERFDRVSYERVCSGIGIPNIYTWLRDTGRYPEPEGLRERLAVAADPTPVIAEAGLKGSPPLCVATLDTFVSILASEAGNLALKVLATGGIFIGGGIPPRNLSALTSERFMPAFTAKGRLSDLLEQMPVHIIRNPRVALLGAAYAGMQE
jgi:glucokinase